MTIRCTPAWWAAGCWSPPDPDRVRVWCEATWSPTIYGLGRHQTITDPAHVRAAEALRQQRFALVRPAAETEVEQRQSSDSDVESRPTCENPAARPRQAGPQGSPDTRGIPAGLPATRSRRPRRAGRRGLDRDCPLPAPQSLEEFDFDHAIGLKRNLIAHLATSDFVASKENVSFLGPPGIQSHCAYRDALVEDGIPDPSIPIDDIEAAERARLTSNGVVFTQPPTDIGTAVVAVFDETCGNLIQLIEEKPDENHDDAR
jgi:hypothetical protein